MISNIGSRFRFRHLRLSTKLIVTYILLTVIPMSMLGYISYRQYARSVEEQIGEYMPRFLYQANADIEKHIDELSKLPDMLFNSDNILGILRRQAYRNRSDLNKDQYSMDNYLARTYINGSYPDVIGVYVLSGGRTFHSARLDFEEADWNEVLSQYEEGAPKPGRVKIVLPGELRLHYKSRIPYVFIEKPINDMDNRKILGQMLIAVDLTFIDHILRNFETDRRAELWVMSPSGRIVYHTDRNQIGTVDPNLPRYPVHNGSFRSYASSEPKLMSVNESSGLGWVLVHSVPLKDLTKRTDLVRNVTITVFIIIIFVTLAIAVFLSWNMTRPLKKLSSLMKTVEMGNFQVDLKVQSGDEVGTLARSFNSMIATIRDLIQRNYQIEIRQKEAELYALQSQINPHFMYNTLEAIGMAVEEGERESVVEMVTLLGRMLRFSVSNPSKSVTIGEEVQHVKDYLTIQKYRFEDRLNFEIARMLDDRDLHTLYTPKFILQPVVENAIKHGLESRRSLQIHIAISREFGARSGKHDIVFRVRDNGPGIPPERLEELERLLRNAALEKRDSQFGLSNVGARIVMTHGPQYGLQLHSIAGKGTEVTIRIPTIREPGAADRTDNEEG